MLDEEIAYFCENRAEWQAMHAGRVALVSGRALVGFYDNEVQALAEGARRFGLRPFLVRRIGLEESEVSIPALTLGLTGANPPHPVLGDDS
jgi:hypothetical protein